MCKFFKIAKKTDKVEKNEGKKLKVEIVED